MALLEKRTPHSIRQYLAFALQPIIGFGLVLIAIVWLGTWSYVQRDEEQSYKDLATEASNLALVFEQNVLRTATDMDRIIKFLRRMHERSAFSASWQGLISDEYTINDESVQIAIIDRSGMMIASTAMLNPPKPVDLSDREHFRIHADRQTDELYISRPLLGRASGKWSVQFTRPFWNAEKKFAGVIVVSLDPTHLTRAYSDLKLGQGHGLALVGSDGIIRAGAGTLSSALGSTNELLVRNETVVINGANVTRLPVRGVQMLVAARTLAAFPLEVVVSAREPSGSELWQFASSGYAWGASAFSLLAFLAMSASAINRHRFETKILRLARHDTLTGLGNRLYLTEYLQRSFTCAAENTLYMLLIDLDGFKDVNDTHGHPLGDELLIEVGQRLTDLLPNQQCLVRLGGDEFAIVVDDTIDAFALAEDINTRLRESFQIDGFNLNIGGSIGVANRDGCTSTAELMKRADLALYVAKEAGRGTYRVYREAMDTAARERITMFNGLRDALAERRFEVHYQPIVNAKTSKIECYEALLRWKNGDKGYVPPSAFIPLAEATGLIIPIGAWILEQACSDLVSRCDEASVAVNCSTVQLRAGNFVETVQRVLTATGLPAERLKIEITESVLMDKDSAAISQLRELVALGVSVALDDFGTGYSSLSYLEAYPVSYLKLDRSFVVEMEKKASTLAIVRMIISLARCLDITTIAEGVETNSQLELLRALGCDQIQGYLFSRPASADEIFGKDFCLGPMLGPRAYPALAARRS